MEHAGRVEIATLGALRVTVDGEVADIRLSKAIALLVYLAETARPHGRSALAGLLWPDRSEDAARNNLRQTLTALRKVIGDRLVVTGDRIQVSHDVTIDTRPLDVERYRGPFLDGFWLGDSDLFDEWITRTRATHESVALTLLIGHAETALDEGDLVRSRLAAHRVLAIEPWSEPAHRVLMRAAASERRVPEAVQQYDRCVAELWQRLGLRPDAETVRLLAMIEASGVEHVPVPVVHVPATRLFGRADDIARVGKVVSAGELRLITLVGPGGIGKTRLALAVADEVGAQFADGVIVVGLDGTDDPSRVVSVMAAACGLSEFAADASALADTIASRHQLLIVDNAEHVAEAVAGALETIVGRAARVACLVTSRTVLGSRSEHVEWVDGIAADVPDPAMTSPAVDLFLDRAHRVVRSVESLDTVKRICRQLAGYPLAIELAAGRLGRMSADELLASLPNAPELLASDAHDVPERQRSLVGMLDTTFDALEPHLAGAMERLSVFRAGLSRAAAVAVAELDPAALQILVGRSLLIAADDGRFEIHELVRQHAARRLGRDHARAGAVHDTHARHFLSTLTDAEAALAGHDAVATRDRLMRDFDNVLAAWTRAVERGEHALLLRSADALRALGDAGGRAEEVAGALLAAAAACDGAVRAELAGQAVMNMRQRCAFDEVARRYRYGMHAADAALGPAARRGRVLLMLGYGQALERHGDLAESRALLADARALVEELDEPRLTALARIASVRTETTAGDFDAANDLLQPTLAYFEEQGDLAGLADATSRLAMVYAEQFRVGPTLDAELAALRLFSVIGDRSRVAVCELNVGDAYAMVGAWDAAERHTRAAIAAFDDIDVHYLDAYLACQLAEILAGRGDVDEAERQFVAGIGAIRQSGDGSSVRMKLPEWGRFLVERGRYAQACVVLDEAVRVWMELGNEHHALTARAILARALLGAGEVAEARTLAGDVWEAIERREAKSLPYPFETIADCARVLGDGDPRLADMQRLGRRLARAVAAEITDAALQAGFFDLDDVRYLHQPIT